MTLIECLNYLRDTGVNIDDALKEMQIIASALESSENALLDYVPKFEKAGATMGYGRAVIETVKIALLVIEHTDPLWRSDDRGR
jgi:hypothetical protein